MWPALFIPKTPLRAFIILKRGIISKFHKVGSSKKYLKLYVDWFEFKIQQLHEWRYLWSGYSGMLKDKDYINNLPFLAIIALCKIWPTDYISENWNITKVNSQTGDIIYHQKGQVIAYQDKSTIDWFGAAQYYVIYFQHNQLEITNDTAQLTFYNTHRPNFILIVL